jgi:hypothetical protein
LESGAQLKPISEEEASTEREKIASAAGESKRKTLKRNTAAKVFGSFWQQKERHERKKILKRLQIIMDSTRLVGSATIMSHGFFFCSFCAQKEPKRLPLPKAFGQNKILLTNKFRHHRATHYILCLWPPRIIRVGRVR